MIDNTTRQLVRCAQDEIETVLRSVNASAHCKMRPTIKQLNAMVASLENAKRFTAAVLSSDKT